MHAVLKASLGVVLSIVLAICANAQTQDTGDSTDQGLNDARNRMAALQLLITAGASVEDLGKLRVEAVDLQAHAEAIAARLTLPSRNVQARLAELGAIPTDKTIEAPRITAERNGLREQQERVDAQLRLARLIGVESQQASEQIDNLRRVGMTARMTVRSTSLLSTSFWTTLLASWPHDAPRLKALWTDLEAAVAASDGWSWLLAGLITIAAIGLVPRGLALIARVIAKRMPQGRIRRSTYALAATLLPTAAALCALQALRWALLSGGEASSEAASLADGIVNALAFATYVAALGGALLSSAKPSWRLPAIPDPIATTLRYDPPLLGLVIALVWLLDRVADLVNTGLEGAVAVTCLSSLLVGAVIVRMARRGERARYRMLASDHPEEVPPRSLLMLVLIVGSWVLLVASAISLVIGYVALGTLFVRQVAWVLIVGNSAYLLASFIDDACAAWLGDDEERSEKGQDDDKDISPPRRQAAVLLSGTSRILITVIALSTMLAPLGQDPQQLLERATHLSDGVTIGEFRILPGAVFEALAILVVGIIAVRSIQHWMLERYLPTTRLDAGMRSSTTTLLGYVGLVFAAALSLSALGIGVERIAWVASALSVGIGFGLQAVVQNFVSGLILLTERPVKVGDWVVLGDVEGDIRRINVRATEIQMGDRSTVIVPNSEFITKVVRNMTMANPMGLVVIRLPMPLDTDVERVRTTIVSAFAAHEDVLAHPAPAVQLDAVVGGQLMFVATGSVGSPRQAGAVRSALLFAIIGGLRDAGIALSSQPTLVLRRPAGSNDAAGSTPAKN